MSFDPAPTTGAAGLRPDPADPIPSDAGTGLDVDALLAGVYRRHRRHQRRRLAGSGVGVMVASALAAFAVTGGGNPSTPVPGGATVTEVAALTPYAMTAARDAAPVAVVDGLELTYLPPGLPAQPAIETGTTGVGERYTLGCFGDPGCSGGLGVAVTRSPGLDLARYQQTHWIGEAPTETTVGGHPALASGVASDEATGLVWSPLPGVVIEINIDSDMAAELRPIVDGARFAG